MGEGRGVGLAREGDWEGQRCGRWVEPVGIDFLEVTCEEIDGVRV